MRFIFSLDKSHNDLAKLMSYINP